MMLRKRQRIFVDKCSPVLKARKNTIGVAPTGAGKTIMMAAMCLENAPKELPSLTLQHRDELVGQNLKKFVKYAGATNIRRPMRIDADSKAWDKEPGGWNFGMIQTIIKNLDSVPKLGMLAIDECHHSAADTYLQLVNKVKSDNPECLIYGTTATPNRGDRKALKMVFDNCGDNIQIGEVIRSGHLVRPRTFVIDIGVNKELQGMDRHNLDMNEVEHILNKQVLNDKVIDNWEGFKDKNGNLVSARNRQTIVFCSTIQHAKDVTQSFKNRGYKAEYVAGQGEMAKGTRRGIIARYDRNEIQVLINVSVLTEGFDHQPTSCVILLRPESWKSTMTQMIGRGLRKVDPELYPGVIKDDCIVLDFGTSCITHGSLEEDPDLYGRGVKMCPACESSMPQSIKECIICGHEFPIELLLKQPGSSPGSSGDGEVDEKTILDNFVMSEIDILQDSPFKYESFYDGRVMLCFGFSYWAAVIHYQDMRYYAIGAEENSKGSNSFKLHILNSSDNYLMALQSADDYMRTRSNKTNARRVAKWVYEPPTAKQLQILAEDGTAPVNRSMAMNMSKYRACCGIQFKFYGRQMQAVIEGMKRAAA